MSTIHEIVIWILQQAESALYDNEQNELTRKHRESQRRLPSSSRGLGALHFMMMLAFGVWGMITA
jgi:hypothetical protein